MKYKAHSLTAFVMQWANLFETLKPVESDAVMENIFFPVQESEVDHYWQRFSEMPPNRA